MKEVVKFNVSIGALLTLITYVTGFTWQYTYLGVITNDINWIKIVTSDYIHLGVMAILFIMKPWAVVVLVIMLSLALSGLLDRVFARIWRALTFKGKLALHPYFNFLETVFGGGSSGKIFTAYLVLFLISLSVVLKITDVSAQHMASRLSSAGVDMVCNKQGECYVGKLLYIGDKQIYFYSFEDKEEITEGTLKLVSVADWTATMAWNEMGREVINQHIASGD